MPVINTNGQFNIGRDCQLVMVGQYGEVVLNNVTSFQAKQLTEPVKVSLLDGIHLHTDIPMGWDFTFTLERGDPTLDNYFALAEQAYVTVGALLLGSLSQYVTEVGNGQSRYQYINASFKFDDAGEWKANASVKQTVSGMAGQRLLF